MTPASPLLLALALAAAPATTAPPTGPTETLKAADRALRGALAAGQDGARLGDAVAPFVDYEELARRSLGRRWAAQRPADRAALVKALRALLEATYLTGLRFDPKATFTVATTRRTGEVAEVKGSAASDGEVVPLELRLRRGADGRWRIFDATVAGLALVEGYQEQFPQLLDLGGMPRLLQQLEAETRAKLGAPAPTAATSGATSVTPKK